MFVFMKNMNHFPARKFGFHDAKLPPYCGTFAKKKRRGGGKVTISIHFHSSTTIFTLSLSLSLPIAVARIFNLGNWLSGIDITMFYCCLANKHHILWKATAFGVWEMLRHAIFEEEYFSQCGGANDFRSCCGGKLSVP